MKLLMAAACLSLPIVSNAQTENPRGIYKMMTLTGKQGEIKAPFDQYKICTDSVTLMLNVQGTSFQIQDTDHMVFYYTGEQPKDENDKSTLIYDSNAEHFTLKWWNSGRGHLYFPDNNWCIEKYEANQYSEIGRPTSIRRLVVRLSMRLPLHLLQTKQIHYLAHGIFLAM